MRSVLAIAGLIAAALASKTVTTVVDVTVTSCAPAYTECAEWEDASSVEPTTSATWADVPVASVTASSSSTWADAAVPVSSTLSTVWSDAAVPVTPVAPTGGASTWVVSPSPQDPIATLQCTDLFAHRTPLLPLLPLALLLPSLPTSHPPPSTATPALPPRWPALALPVSPPLLPFFCKSNLQASRLTGMIDMNTLHMGDL